MNQADTIVIGAGLSGLVLARQLAGKTILLEKSRGVGGRLATRRIDDIGLDHGALYLQDHENVRNVFLKNFVALQASEEGLFCFNGMTNLPKALSKSLDIRKETRAQKLTRSTSGWEIETDKGETYSAARVVITAPLPQALELLDGSNIAYRPEFKEVSFVKAILALIICDKLKFPDRLSTHLHSITPMGNRNLHPTGYVVRATPAFSEAFFNESDETNLKILQEDFNQSFEAAPEIKHSEIKKWRYALPRNVLKDPFAELDSNLFLIGDSFLSPNAAGAVESALALAQKLT